MEVTKPIFKPGTPSQRRCIRTQANEGRRSDVSFYGLSTFAQGDVISTFLDLLGHEA